ncbi:MAG: hypothetical protein AAFX81_07305 [Pseudomonadota bacterium]
MDTRDHYVDNLKKKLDEWNEQITKTQNEMIAASDEAKARYEKQVSDMQAYLADGQARMDALVKSSVADWDKARTNFESAWNDIAAGFGRAWSRFH